METATQPVFKNEAKPRIPNPEHSKSNDYGYDRVPVLLFLWSRLFQIVISQASTYMLGKKFHESECAIYKCEGGCHVPGFGEVVLGPRSCYFDHSFGKKDEQNEAKIAALITKVVLEWDPNDPIESMLKSASSHIGVDYKTFYDAIEKSRAGGVFGGNSLSYFFDWNPFSEPLQNLEYERYCLEKINGVPSVEVDQLFADRALGKQLRKEINEAIKKVMGDHCYQSAMCCSPRRQDDGKLIFWINTGRSTQIDGWKTEEEIREFINSGKPLVDKMR